MLEKRPENVLLNPKFLSSYIISRWLQRATVLSEKGQLLVNQFVTITLSASGNRETDVNFSNTEVIKRRFLVPGKYQTDFHSCLLSSTLIFRETLWAISWRNLGAISIKVGAKPPSGEGQAERCSEHKGRVRWFWSTQQKVIRHHSYFETSFPRPWWVPGVLLADCQPAPALLTRTQGSKAAAHHPLPFLPKAAAQGWVFFLGLWERCPIVLLKAGSEKSKTSV